MPNNILLVNEDPNCSTLLCKGFEKAGYGVQMELNNFPRVLMECQKNPVVFVSNLTTALSTHIHFFCDLKKLNPLPTVVFVPQASKQEIEQGIKSGIHALIVDGLKEARIPAIIETAMIRFNEQQSSEKELLTVKRNLEDRKVIERAKGLLMDLRKMKEEEAYSSLRKMAMDQNKRLADVCQQVIEMCKYIA